jgi:hypothetical protein
MWLAELDASAKKIENKQKRARLYHVYCKCKHCLLVIRYRGFFGKTRKDIQLA